MHGADPPTAPKAARWPLAAVMAVVFALGLLPVAIYLSRKAALYGVTQYDDGVYFAASLRLVSGVLPYRDFVLVQPPGITEILAPFAGFSHLIGERAAIGAARIFTGVVEGLCAACITYLLRHRGLLAAGIGGALFAIFPPAYAADHTFLLEPFLDLFCLIGLALVFSGEHVATPRRALLGGIAFGIAGAVKTFAIVPFVLLVIVLVASRHRREAVHLIGGAAIASVVLLLPFLLIAPHAFYHDVVTSQLSRATERPTPAVSRVYAIVGLSYTSGRAALNLPGAEGLVWAVGAVVGAILLLGGVVPLLSRAWRSAFSVFIVAGAVVVAAVSFIPATYYDHYALFSAAFLALALGEIAGRAFAVAARHRRAAEPRAVLWRGAGAAVALVVGLGCAVVLSASINFNVAARVDKFGDPGPAIEETVPDRGCIVSDAASILVSANRAAPGSPGCPAIIDPTGTWLSIDPLHPPENSAKEPTDPKLVAMWQQIFERANYVVLSGICAFRIPWTPDLYAYFDANYHRLPGPYALAFQRGRPVTPAEQPDLASRCATTRAARS